MRGLIQYVLKMRASNGPEMGIIIEATAEGKEEADLLILLLHEHERQRQMINSVVIAPTDSSDLLSTFEEGLDVGERKH